MNKLERFSLLFLLVTMIFAVPLLATKVYSSSSYYTSMGCSGCHLATPTTCNGCHAHGTHSSNAKSDINVTGATNKASYAPGETVSVTINGGYRTGWLRAVLFDQNTVQLAITSGNDSGMGSSGTYPVTMSAPAPQTPGTYTWKVAWYGNVNDKSGATFGSGWIADPNNPDHGYEIVSTNSFTVTAPADTTAPTVNTFTMPASASSLTVSVTSFTASDAVGVTGYMITSSATPPAAGDAGWSATPPASATAAAAGAVTFFAWAKDAAGNVSTSMNAAVNITLITQNQLSLTMDGTGGGSVNSDISGIACTSGNCSASFDSTATVTLTEIPDSISTFAGWGGDCSVFGTSASCTLPMSSPRNVTATFNSAAEAMIGITGYPSLAAAYGSAASGATIMLKDGNIAGDLTVDKDIILDGGYDVTFTNKTGQPTTLTGLITITSGSLTVDNFALM